MICIVGPKSVHVDVVICSIRSRIRIRKMRTSLLDIRILIMFLLTASTQLLSAIRILDNRYFRPILVFWVSIKANFK